MGWNFTAIDFETANHHRGSPCAVGLARVRDGDVIDAVTWLMRPPAQYSGFEPYQVGVHGISSHRVASEPTFAQVLPRIIDYVGADTVVAHNARFDGAVIAAASIAIGAAPPPWRIVCTLTAAKRCLQLGSYRLPFVADALGVDIGVHHEPGSDAEAAALVLPALAARLGVDSLGEFAAVTQRTMTGTPQWSSEPYPDADPDGALYGRVIVFTGALSSMTRDLAHDECRRVGAVPEKTVTKRTHVLVVGDLDPARLVPGDLTSQKAQKAFALRDAGQDIEVLTEYDFLRLI
jgi:DNA polymerase-3 subunit epsilon